jgi:uncharacterized protein (DUF2062 family)
MITPKGVHFVLAFMLSYAGKVNLAVSVLDMH